MINLEVWLYGTLAQYGGAHKRPGYAELHLEMPDATTVEKLLAHLRLPIEEKGLTFINGVLTDVPGIGADLGQALQDNDRVAIFSTISAWPSQYRAGAATSPELEAALEQAGGALRHDFR